MKKLSALLALFCLTATFATAATKIVVTHSGTDTTYTDMPTAEAAFAPGDTMDIQSFDGPLPWAGDGPTWATIKCTAATPATLLVASGAGSFGPLDHNTYQNLIIDGGSTPDSHKVAGAMTGGTKSTVTNCTIKGFWWYAVYITNGTGEEGVTFTDCYIIGVNSAVGFRANWISAGQTCTNKAIFNHCTIVGGTWWAIDVDTDFVDKDNSNIFSIKNCIVSTRKDNGGSDVARCIIFNSAIPAGTVIDEDYNLFDSWWMVIWAPNDTGKGDPIGTHSVKWDYRSNPDIFKNYAAGDYTLAPGTNPCLKTGEGGTNIGADVTTVPVELSSFSAE